LFFENHFNAHSKVGVFKNIIEKQRFKKIRKIIREKIFRLWKRSR